jgi:hypothetical protein
MGNLFMQSVSYSVHKLCRIFQQVSASLRSSEKSLHQLQIEISVSFLSSADRMECPR